MDRLGYTDFINKHKTKAVLIFTVSILLIFVSPIAYFYTTFHYFPKLVMNTSFYAICVDIILYPITIKYGYEHIQSSTTFNEYFKPYASNYALLSVGSLIFWFTIISLIIVLIQHFKHKKICKPLLYLPLAFYIIYVIISYSLNGGIPFVGFYLAIILEVLVILYCAGFQRFPARKPREHKPTDKERIAELERQVAKLQKEKDAE